MGELFHLFLFGLFKNDGKGNYTNRKTPHQYVDSFKHLYL